MNRSLGLTGLVLAAVAIAGPAASQRNWTTHAKPFHIIGPVYSVGSEGLAVYLIHTRDGDILIDAGVPQIATDIENNIKALGFDPKSLKFLLNSHAHFDHSGGLAQIKRDTGAKVVASELDRESLENGHYLGSETVKALDSVPVKVDRAIKDGDTVTLGGVTLTAHITPGHTRGCTSWTMPVVDAGKTHKIVFFCSASVAANRLAPNPQYPGIVDDYRKTFVKARAMAKDIDIYLAPHAEFFDMAGKRAKLAANPNGPNPFIVPGEFTRAVDNFEAAFNTELAKQQKAAGK
jgi:metallo-beta-lactamase class B